MNAWDIANKASDLLMLRMNRELCTCAGDMSIFQTNSISNTNSNLDLDLDLASASVSASASRSSNFISDNSISISSSISNNINKIASMGINGFEEEEKFISIPKHYKKSSSTRKVKAISVDSPLLEMTKKSLLTGFMRYSKDK